MRYLARVYVTLKPTVNDPQGITVLSALRNLGFESPDGVRVGKYLEVGLQAESEDEARAQIDAMCKTLLANTVIEQYRFDLEETPA
ncbi:MAG: phosphoribosylformylglycinamidine synthase subunit PurS [Chloroflexota bacterium]|nr:phosphoribosylformylglycinamidine synthase subunit PurS [Chloroflexota bacterium]